MGSFDGATAGERALADDHRMHELDRDVRRVGGRGAAAVRDQHAALGECAGDLETRACESVLLAIEELSQRALSLLDRGCEERRAFDTAPAKFLELGSPRIAEPLEERARLGASSSSIFDMAKPTWISTQSPMPTGVGTLGQQAHVHVAAHARDVRLGDVVLVVDPSRRSVRGCLGTC